MKRKHLLFFLITILILNCCTKENTDLRLSDFKTPIIEGYYLRDLQGNSMGIIGYPNVKLSIGSSYINSTYYFSFYPNPCTEEFCAIYVKTPESQKSVKLWITRANFKNQVSNSSLDISNMNNLVIGGSPIFQTEITTNQHNTINLSNFDNGYYRIYLKVDEYLLYDNLVIYRPNK